MNNTINDLDVYTLNALGPYNHGTWVGPNGSLGAEEALEGRANHIVSTFVRWIQSKYTPVEISAMTMIDIGCYDGFLSVAIEKKLKFKRMVGLEPRDKNIAKGKAARAYCNISTDIEFIQGDISSLEASGCVYDIVFCCGVFHHLENLDLAVKILRKCCSRAIFVDSMAYVSSKQIWFKELYDSINRRIIEPKDIIYRFIPKVYAVSGFKFETNYSDGSAVGFSVVNIPSPEQVEMTLEANGFGEIERLCEGEDYQRVIKSKLRSAPIVTIAARINEEAEIPKRISDYIISYECSMILRELGEVIGGAFLRLHHGKSTLLDNLLVLMLSSQNPLIFKYLVPLLMKALQLDSEQKEIVRSIKYSPKDKIRFEIAKILFFNSQIEQAIAVLDSIISRPNSDWRTCYRSFAFFAFLKEKDDTLSVEKFKKLCLLANAQFPLEEFLQRARRA
jgi:ubiquinone/menaquinone biosynthesis C-methylase UbiE